MAGTDALIAQWISANSGRLVLCPYQPGNLKISITVCRKRREAGQKTNTRPFMTEDVFAYRIRQGLLLCQKCPIPKGEND